MSKFVPAELDCGCGTRWKVDVAEALHISRVPEYRDQILAGTFHCFDCPSCGHTIQVERDFAYIDFPRRHWLMVFPVAYFGHRVQLARACRESFRATMVDHCPEIVRQWAPEFTQRTVFGLASLREKLVIFDAGLDDRLVELMKLSLMRAAPSEIGPNGYLHLVSVDDDGLTFQYASVPGQDSFSELVVPLGEYVQIKLDRDRYAGELARRFSDLVVDYRSLWIPDVSELPTT